MAYDPCDPVPDNTIPAGYTPGHRHAAHHVVGRIKHRIHHKFVHLGPPAQGPIPDGCEKHAITGPGYGHGGPGLPAAPILRAAALGGAGVGAAGLGVIGFGLVPPSSITPGEPGSCAKTTIAQGGKVVCVTTTTVPPTVPSPPTTPIVPPTPPTIIPPGTPPTTVPEPSAIALFLVGAAVVMLVRHGHGRRLVKAAVRAG